MNGVRRALLAAMTLCLPALTALADSLDAPVSILRAENSYDVRGDGSFVQTYSVLIHVSTDAAARRQAEQAILYSPSVEEFSVVEAATHKPNGRVLPVPASGLLDSAAPAADLTMLTDQREKVIVFPDVTGGDTLSFTWRREMHRPVFPGEFTAGHTIPRDVPFQQAVLTIRTPSDMVLNTETHGFAASESTTDGVTVHRWEAQGTGLSPGGSVGPFDRLPRVFVSTFRGWAAFGAAYARLTAPHAAVTPAIASLAAELTAGVPDRREQARLIYEWVSRHIRYVAIYQGNGALEAHDAERVLAGGYGDCKDHVVLFDALLAAVGIGADLVMINVGNHYTLSGPPGFSQLNHAISYLPEFDLYADTTTGTAPFGTLPFSEYGKPVIHALIGGGLLRRIPALSDGAAVMETRTTARLDNDGAILGTTLTTATGPFAVELRRIADWVEATGNEAAAAHQLKALGTEGAGAFAYEPPGAFAPDYAVSGSFSLDTRPDIIEGDSFEPPGGLRLLVHPGDLLLGPLSGHGAGAGEATPCYAGAQSEDVTLDLPPGRRLRRLPQGLHIDNRLLTYDSEWSEARGTVSLHRSLVSKATGPLCEGDTRRIAAAALAAIRSDQQRRVALAPALQVAGP